MPKRERKTSIDFFLCGPIGPPEHNTAFHTVARTLRLQGFTVASPVEAVNDIPSSFPELIKESLPLLCASRRIVLLSDWKKCPAGRLLAYLALRLELPFLDVTTMEERHPLPIFKSAAAALGDRQSARRLIQDLAQEEFS